MLFLFPRPREDNDSVLKSVLSIRE